MPGRRKSAKNAPIFSHEFIITNHGDIVSCICMVFMIGLMFQVTAKVAAVFIAPQHNITREINGTDDVIDVVVTYTNGPKDFCTIFFYSLAWIVVHAIIQEYILDKVIRKLHLSKTKNSKFNDSGELLPFYFASAAWGADIIMKEKFFPSITNLWEGYPHNEMSFVLKFYFILQIAHWMHCFPELYFMKARKKAIANYLSVTTFVSSEKKHHEIKRNWRTTEFPMFRHPREPRGLNVRTVNHCLKLVINKGIALPRYGLPRLENAALNVDIGNFNIPFIRITAMAGVILVQAWLAWNFIKYQIRLWRENSSASSPKKKEPRKKAKKEQLKKKADEQIEEESDEETAEEKNGGVKQKTADRPVTRKEAKKTQ
ncbi:hypothetical protein QZH41_003927 [Actinostola sp. cb2023]|nr:hypothetical protein QZH41_003927 [Actinostola sp. cb2023]